SWQDPFFVIIEYNLLIIYFGCCQASEFRCDVRIWIAARDQTSQIRISLRCNTKIFLFRNQVLADPWADLICTCELLCISKNAKLTRAARPTHIITGMDAHSELLNDFPHLPFQPTKYRSMMIHNPWCTSIPQICAVWFPNIILISGSRFFTSFARKHQY